MTTLISQLTRSGALVILLLLSTTTSGISGAVDDAVVAVGSVTTTEGVDVTVTKAADIRTTEGVDTATTGGVDTATTGGVDTKTTATVLTKNAGSSTIAGGKAATITPKNKKHNGLSMYAIIGISVGGFVFVIVVLILLACLGYYCRHKKSPPKVADEAKSDQSDAPGIRFNDDVQKATIAENGDLPLAMNGDAHPGDLPIVGYTGGQVPIATVPENLASSFDPFAPRADQPYAGALDDAISKYVPVLHPEPQHPRPDRTSNNRTRDKRHKGRSPHPHPRPMSEPGGPIEMPPIRVSDEVYGPATIKPAGYVSKYVPENFSAIPAPEAFNEPITNSDWASPQVAPDGNPMITAVQRSPVGGPGGLPCYLPHLLIPTNTASPADADGEEEGVPPTNPNYTPDPSFRPYRSVRNPSRPPFPGARALPGMTKNLTFKGTKGLHRYNAAEYP